MCTPLVFIVHIALPILSTFNIDGNSIDNRLKYSWTLHPIEPWSIIDRIVPKISLANAVGCGCWRVKIQSIFAEIWVGFIRTPSPTWIPSDFDRNFIGIRLRSRRRWIWSPAHLMCAQCHRRPIRTRDLDTIGYSLIGFRVRSNCAQNAVDFRRYFAR